MNQLDLLQRISKYLARFTEQVKILNSNNEFSINIHAENLLIKLLNSIYNLNLKNVNYSSKGEYPAIDLLDENAGISIQVTATNKIEKIKSTIEKFFRHEQYKTVHKLKVFIITEKQKNGYSKEVIYSKINEELELLLTSGKIKDKREVLFSFNISEDVIDRSDLYKILNHCNDFEKIKAVEKQLREQYETIEEQDNLLSYHQKLKNLFYDVVMDDENGMTLDQIFVDPTFSIFPNAFKKEDARILDRNNQFLPVDPRYKLKEFVDETLQCENHLGLSENYRMLLLLGYPGQGKSSFCKKFLNEYITSKKNETKNVYYFTLRNIRQVRDFIFNPLNTLYEEACLQTSMELDRYQFNKSVLILDGLDELYMRESLKLDEIDKLCKELSIIVDKFSELFLILTSRYGYVDLEKIYKERIIITQLASFSLELQNEWLEKFKKFHPDTWLTSDKLNKFNEELKYKHLKELVEQPLLLHMIASVKEEINERTNRAKIYSQLFTELIERKYSKDGQLEIFQKVTREDLRELIREIAFGIFQTGNEYITKPELFKLEATHNFVKLFPEDNLRDSIKGIMISFYFKEVEKSKDDEVDDRSNFAIEFLHKSLREYLTAEKIYHTIRSEFLDKRSSGKYYIDDSKSALETIFALLHRQDLTNEIILHLKEIIANDNITNKDVLCDRLCVFIEDFLNCDFLLEYKSSQQHYPVNISLRCFFGFWNIVSALGIKKNYLLNKNIATRFVELLTMISSVEMYSIANLDFSFQVFTNTSLLNIGFFHCLFNSTTFDDMELSNVKFIRCIFRNSSFSDLYIDDLWLNISVMENVEFTDVYFADSHIRNSRFNNVTFIDSKFEGLSIENYDHINQKLHLENIRFENTRMDEESYGNFSQFYPEIKHSDIYSIEGSSEVTVKEEDASHENEAIPENYKRILSTNS